MPDETLAPPQRRGRDQTIWVGLFLVLGLLAALGALFVLTDAAMFRGRYIVTTQVTDAGGIRKGDPVQMRGVNIGRVHSFKISQQGVEIHLEIQGEYEIPKDSRVELKSAGLMGGLLADIVPGKSQDRVRYGDSLAGGSGEALVDVTNRIATQVDTVAQRMQSLLTPETIQHVQGGAADMHHALRELSGTLDEQRKELRGLVESLRRSSQGLERAAAGPQLEQAVQRLDRITQRLDAVSASADRSSRALENVVAGIERGEGTLGKLTHDSALYDNMNQATSDFRDVAKELRDLARDVKQNPKRYVKLSLF